jgi:ATP-dependent Clp protease ATP-binding subunit ClpA
MIVLRSIGSIQKDLKRMAMGETESIDISSDAAQLLEMTEIINTLNELKAGGSDDSSQGSLSGSSCAKDALKLAKAESKKRGKKVVSSTDLLLALLKVQEGPVAEMFRNSGLTYEGAAQEVEKFEDQAGPEESAEVEDLSEGLEIIDDEQLEEFMGVWPNLNEESRDKIMKFIRDSMK